MSRIYILTRKCNCDYFKHILNIWLIADFKLNTYHIKDALKNVTCRHEWSKIIYVLFLKILSIFSLKHLQEYHNFIQIFWEISVFDRKKERSSLYSFKEREDETKYLEPGKLLIRVRRKPWWKIHLWNKNIIYLVFVFSYGVQSKLLFLADPPLMVSSRFTHVRPCVRQCVSVSEYS